MAVGVLQLTTVFSWPLLFALPAALRAPSFGRYKWTAVVLFVNHSSGHALLRVRVFGAQPGDHRLAGDRFESDPGHRSLCNQGRNVVAVHGYREPQKSLALAGVDETVVYLGGYTRIEAKEFVFVIVGVVVAVSIFVNPNLDSDQTHTCFESLFLVSARASRSYLAPSTRTLRE